MYSRWALYLVAGWFLSASTIAAVNGYLGRPISVRVAVREGSRFCFSALGLLLLVLLCVVPSSCACCLPLIWVLPAFSLALPALIVERKGLGAGISRSMRLAHGAFGPICGKVLMLVLLVWLISQSLPAVPYIFMTDTAPSPWVLLATNALSQIAAVILWPIVVTALVVFYFDQRARIEGLDVLTAFSALQEEEEGVSRTA
jgi:hypothetical protein